MATFVLHSDITIGNFRFSGVHDVRIKRNLKTCIDTAFIKIPSYGKVKFKKQSSLAERITIAGLFNDGDPVTIYLGYSEGSMREEFRGFVKRRDLGLPLEIECEGYSWLLKRNVINGKWKSIGVEELLNIACGNITLPYGGALPLVGDKKTKIKVVCPHDTQLINLEAVDATGLDIIEAILRNTDHALTIFFIEPDVLWCGLAYTPYQEGNDIFARTQVKYRLGYNVVQDNSLKQRTLEDNPHTQIYIKKTMKGQKLYGSSDAAFQQIRKYKKFLNRIASTPELQFLAQEKMLHENYIGYEGKISAFLQPYALPGYTAYVTDFRYPERDGVYIIEGTEVTFGTGGARRILDIGPRVGFVDNVITAQ